MPRRLSESVGAAWYVVILRFHEVHIIICGISLRMAHHIGCDHGLVSEPTTHIGYTR